MICTDCGKPLPMRGVCLECGEKRDRLGFSPQWDHLTSLREVPGQGVCALERFVYTTGLLTRVKVDDGWCYDYAARYCYELHSDAKAALATWDGAGDPPGPWVKEKVTDRLGPGANEPACCGSYCACGACGNRY